MRRVYFLDISSESGCCERTDSETKGYRNMKLLAATGLLCSGMLAISAQDIQQELKQKLAAAKESVARNQAALRQYTWTSHTEILRKGEVKKTKDEMCRYGPDGTVQKTELGPPPEQHEKRGLRGRVVEKKKDELQDYMERAVALIHNYVPPAAEKMEQAFQAGGVSLGQAGPGTIQLQIRNYLKQGDTLTLSFDAAAKVLRRLNVNSYLDDPGDAVTLEVDFQTLPDGTNYAAATVLNAEAKKLQVRTQNANYQRAGA